MAVLQDFFAQYRNILYNSILILEIYQLGNVTTSLAVWLKSTHVKLSAFQFFSLIVFSGCHLLSI